MTEQKELPCPLFTERGFHDWRWIGWPLSMVMYEGDGNRILDGTEQWCDVCGLLLVFENGKWNQRGIRQPAEGERVKEAHARDTAQEIVIESSKAAGYADSAWLDGNFKHELTNRITAALSLLAVQPAQQSIKDEKMKAALEDFRKEMEEKVIPAIENDLRERAVLADNARRRGPLFGTTPISPVVEEMQAAINDPITPEGVKGCYQRAIDEIQRLTVQPAASTPTERCTCDHFEHKDTGECLTCGLFCGPVSNEVAQADLRAWSSLDDGSDIWCDDCRGYTHRSDCPSYKPAAASTEPQNDK